ncbi:MAG: hypothetical protein K2Z80_34180 [Xanthobacteraceae bacterium]|nr:hypothetical protein [Xanthobacteraceae bacterium]
MRRNRISLTIVWFGLIAWPASDAAAEKIRGPETCTSGKYGRTIGGKQFMCSTKCTVTVTETTCNPNCSTTVRNETTYKDCTEASAGKPSTRNYGVRPQGGILETERGMGGGGPGPAGQPVRPPAPRAPVLR